MAMLVPVSGTFNFLSLGAPTLTQINEVVLRCDTSSTPCTITLPKISSLGGQLTFRVKVDDYSNNAGTNPILVNSFSGDFFVGTQTQVIVNSNGASGEFVVVGENKWMFMIGESQSPYFTGRVVMTPPDVYALHTTPFTIVPAVTGHIIKPVVCVGTLDFNTISYSTGELVNATYNSFNNINNSAAFTTAFITGATAKIQDITFTSIQAINATSSYSDYLSKSWTLVAPSAITLGNSDIVIDFQYMLIDQP